MADWGFETRQVHSGGDADPATGARAVPIYQTSSFVFRDTDHAAALFGLAELGNIYTRIMNPTQDAFEQRMVALEGGVGALAVASGQAAQTIALLNLAENGGHIVSSSSLYGGTYNQLHYTFPKLGIEVSFVDDPDDLDAWKAAIRPNTKALYGESIGNPRVTCSTSKASPRSRTTTASRSSIDNTLASPYLIQPLRHGVDIVVHSATKFIGGHGTSIGGVIVDGGSFDYVASGRFPGFTEPDPSYHGLVFSQLPEELRPAQYILKARLQYQRDIGPAISPFNAFLFLQGLQTLSIRMERHCQNALAVANWLEGRDEVTAVAYPGLKSSKWYDRGQKYAPRRSGRDHGVRAQGRLRRGAQFHRQPRAVQPSRQRRRRAQPRDPPGEHDAQPARASPSRQLSGVTPGLVRLSDRHRDPRRHPRRPRRRLPRREVGLTRMRTCVTSPRYTRSSHAGWS